MAERAATCAGCGCGCDDIDVAVAAGALERASGTCVLGDAWLAERTGDAPPVARVDGREVDFADAVEASAAILGDARLPLVCGLGQTDCESQRAAVALAEAVGGVIDPTGPEVDGAAGAASQAIGVSTASFGELRDRAELVVTWLADPVTSNPRLLPRLRLDRAGRAAERTLVVIDARRTATADEADEFIELPPQLELQALWAMRALVRDVPLDRDLAARLPLDALERLAGRLRTCNYAALIYDAGLTTAYVNALGLLALVRDLARVAHVVALPLRHEGNARGAEDVLAWQTGYPAAVSFARGHPRARPGEFTAAELLARGETDAALIVGFDALRLLPPRAADHLRRIPTIVIDPRDTETGAGARVAFATAAAGVHRDGTAHRMDGVPVALRAPLPSDRVGDGDVLAAIEARVTRGEEP
ncbi:MAG: formylmethanofuran dehydrogenase subunit B [Thermoleophilaceae bacterium]|nr:formylmethanofuran dehydrogenase subunit B [Thermoleophilaceae bacterium]